MNPVQKNEDEQQAAYQKRILDLIAVGHNTRSAKRLIARESRKGRK